MTALEEAGHITSINRTSPAYYRLAFESLLGMNPEADPEVMFNEFSETIIAWTMHKEHSDILGDHGKGEPISSFEVYILAVRWNYLKYINEKDLADFMLRF